MELTIEEKRKLYRIPRKITPKAEQKLLSGKRRGKKWTKSKEAILEHLKPTIEEELEEAERHFKWKCDKSLEKKKKEEEERSPTAPTRKRKEDSSAPKRKKVSFFQGPNGNPVSETRIYLLGEGNIKIIIYSSVVLQWKSGNFIESFCVFSGEELGKRRSSKWAAKPSNSASLKNICEPAVPIGTPAQTTN